jgi:PHP family Zn ribbon phosphoesterase
MSQALFSEPQTPLAKDTRQQLIREFEQLLPETTEQVQEILAICNQHKVPVVARGAGTGLSGGLCRWSTVLCDNCHSQYRLSVTPAVCIGRYSSGSLGAVTR